MPMFRCQVYDSLGKKKKINFESISEDTLKYDLKQENYHLISAKVVKEKQPNMFFAVSSKVKVNEVVAFLRQFAVMIRSSIPISDSLNILRQQNYSKAFRTVLNEVYHDVVSGVYLSDAFAKHPKVFPQFFTSMVSIGEVSGNLDNVLEEMADYYENDRRIKRKAKSALTYPMFLFALLIIVSLFILLYILPIFKKTIEELGGQLPKITIIVMAASDFVVDNILFILYGIIVVGLLCFLFFFKTKKGKYIKDYLKMHLPLIGKIQKSLITSRFSKAFIILLGSGMNMTGCLENLHKMLGNMVFKEKFAYTIEEVKRGRRLAQSIESIRVFPKLLVEMINIGERSGNLEDVLKSSSAFFDDNVETAIAKATAALEPIMIVFLGIVVGIVILSVLMPMLSMMGSV